MEGEREVSWAGGWRSVTEALCDAPPPGVGFETEKLNVPAEAKRAAGATAVSSVALTKVVVNVLVPAVTTVEELKFVPVRVNVVSGEPA